MTTRIDVTGSLTVDAPPEQAFELFTPRGEQAWVPGWAPTFPHETPDDAAAGTVFQTTSGGHVTTWIVVRSSRGRLIKYARVVANRHAGTVEVRLEAKKKGSLVMVSYDLTALTQSAADDLETFALVYDAFLQAWEESIRLCLARD